jgi:hypothetical protein
MDTGMERALKDGVQRLQQNLWPINRVVSQTTTRTESSSVFTVNPLLGEYLKPIAVPCKKHRVEALHTFESVNTDRFTEGSDIDFLVSFEPMDAEEYAEHYFQLVEGLEAIFQRPVDLLTVNSLKNPYFIEAINRTKQHVYGRRDLEVSF